MCGKRVFLLTSSDSAMRYGIGKYVDILTKQAAVDKGEQVNLIVVKLNDKDDTKDLFYLKKSNVVIFKIPNSPTEFAARPVSRLHSLGIVCLLDEYFQLTEEDIFHFNLYTHLEFAKIIREKVGCTLFYTLHFSLFHFYYKNEKTFEQDFFRGDKPYINELAIEEINKEIEFCRLVDKVIALNGTTIQHLTKYYATDMGKVRLIENGIGAMRTNLETVKKIKNSLQIKDECVILFVGRIDESKGVDVLIETFKRLKAKGEKIRLILVGGGKIDQFIVKIKYLWSDITFVGYASQKEVAAYYELSQIVVLLSSHEQGSYTVLEAMASKKPLIVSDIDAFNFLTDNENAYKISMPLDSRPNLNMFTKVLCQLSNDSAKREYLAKNAYRLFKRRFTSEKMFNSLKKLYFEKKYEN